MDCSRRRWPSRPALSAGPLGLGLRLSRELLVEMVCEICVPPRPSGSDKARSARQIARATQRPAVPACGSLFPTPAANCSTPVGGTVAEPEAHFHETPSEFPRTLRVWRSWSRAPSVLADYQLEKARFS
jgi:hypothetical protein